MERQGFVSMNSAAQVKAQVLHHSARGKTISGSCYHLTLRRRKCLKCAYICQDAHGRQRTQDGLILLSVQKHRILSLVICSYSLHITTTKKVFSTQRQKFTTEEEFKIFSWIDFPPLPPLIQYKSLQRVKLPTLPFREPELTHTKFLCGNDCNDCQ